MLVNIYHAGSTIVHRCVVFHFDIDAVEGISVLVDKLLITYILTGELQFVERDLFVSQIATNLLDVCQSDVEWIVVLS